MSDVGVNVWQMAVADVWAAVNMHAHWLVHLTRTYELLPFRIARPEQLETLSESLCMM